MRTWQCPRRAPGGSRREVLAEAHPLGLPGPSSVLDMKQSSCVALVSVTFADTYRSLDVKTTFKDKEVGSLNVWQATLNIISLHLHRALDVSLSQILSGSVN